MRNTFETPRSGCGKHTHSQSSFAENVVSRISSINQNQVLTCCPHQLGFLPGYTQFSFYLFQQQQEKFTEKSNIVTHTHTHTPYFNQLLQILQHINVLDSDIHFFSLALVKISDEVYTEHNHLSTDNCSSLGLSHNLMVNFFCSFSLAGTQYP